MPPDENDIINCEDSENALRERLSSVTRIPEDFIAECTGMPIVEANVENNRRNSIENYIIPPVGFQTDVRPGEISHQNCSLFYHNYFKELRYSNGKNLDMYEPLPFNQNDKVQYIEKNNSDLHLENGLVYTVYEISLIRESSIQEIQLKELRENFQIGTILAKDFTKYFKKYE